MDDRDGLGQWGEDLAESYLRERGWRIEDRNVMTPVGECDLIAWDASTLVFVEVKTRSHTRFGTPEESVTPEKQEQVIRTARYVLSQRNETPQCRFDVIAIVLRGTSSTLRHHRGAFEPPE